MKTLTELSTDKSTFSIGRAFSDGWALVSKHLGYYILGGIVSVVISIVAGIIPFVGNLASQLILRRCLMAGAIYVTWRISKGIGCTDLVDMFKGFKFLSPIIISATIQFAVMVTLAVLFLLNYLNLIIKFFEVAQGPGVLNNQEEIRELFRQILTPESVMLFLFLMFFILLISIIWVFKIHFIVIYKMQAWPAMEMSRKIATRNLFPLIGYFLLMGIIIIISAIPCGIGLLFSLPLMIGSSYSAFAQITHCDEPDEINEEMFDFLANNKTE